MQAKLENEAAAATDRYANLAEAFAGLKLQWETRGPREEDVREAEALRAAIAERDAQLSGINRRFNELHNVRTFVTILLQCTCLLHAESIIFVECTLCTPHGMVNGIRTVRGDSCERLD